MDTGSSNAGGLKPGGRCILRIDTGKALYPCFDVHFPPYDREEYEWKKK